MEFLAQEHHKVLQDLTELTWMIVSARDRGLANLVLPWRFSSEKIDIALLH